MDNGIHSVRWHTGFTMIYTWCTATRGYNGIERVQ